MRNSLACYSVITTLLMLLGGTSFAQSPIYVPCSNYPYYNCAVNSGSYSYPYSPPVVVAPGPSEEIENPEYVTPHGHGYYYNSATPFYGHQYYYNGSVPYYGQQYYYQGQFLDDYHHYGHPH